MRRWTIVLVYLLAFFGSGHAETSHEGTASGNTLSGDWQTVRSDVDALSRLQDAAADGAIAAVTAQKDMLIRINKRLAAIRNQQHPVSVPWVAAYVLSGGNPEVAEHPSVLETMAVQDRELLHASALFMNGDRQKADSLFRNIDPVSLPARLGGRVALAKAFLASASDNQAYFALAASAMPGTLIEESALRRSAIAYSDARIEHEFWSRLARYARRFPNSVYAMPFWGEILASLVTWVKAGPSPDIHRLDLVVSQLSREQRRAIYLSLARQSAADGQAELTEFAARRLMRLSADGSPEEHLAHFYTALFDIVSVDDDRAIRTLKSIRHEWLAPQDLALLAAALSLSRQIDGPLAVPDVEAQAGAELSSVEGRGIALLERSLQVMSEDN